MYRIYEAVSEIGFGSQFAVVLFVALFAVALTWTRTRLLAGIFGLAWLLFVFIPVAISSKQPIIVDRYWLIGLPSFIVFVIFLMRSAIGAATGAFLRPYSAAVVAAALVLLVIADAGGLAAARVSIEEKLIWRGAAVVAARVASCPSASIHVYPGVPFLFALAARAPASLFVPAQSPQTPVLHVADAECPVLGWAEHIVFIKTSSPQRIAIADASAEQLLEQLKIDALPSQVKIDRYPAGYVVTKR
jgi:hypothetical protein